MDFQEVEAYIQKLHFKGPYEDLDQQQRESLIFETTELLSDEFGRDKLTPRAVALQALYMLEGEAEEFAKLKRHGVSTFSAKDVSVSFNNADIAPAVLKIFRSSSSRAQVGRLI